MKSFIIVFMIMFSFSSVAVGQVIKVKTEVIIITSPHQDKKQCMKRDKKHKPAGAIFGRPTPHKKHRRGLNYKR